MGSGSGLQPPNIESSGFRALALRVTGLRCWVMCVCVGVCVCVCVGVCVCVSVCVCWCCLCCWVYVCMQCCSSFL